MTEPHTVYPRHLPRNFTVRFPISSIWKYVENLLTFYNSLTIFFCFSVQATTWHYLSDTLFQNHLSLFVCISNVQCFSRQFVLVSLTFTSSLYKDIVVIFSFKHFIHKYIVT